MTRTRIDRSCHECKQTPSWKDGRLKCACEDKPWLLISAEKGTSTEEQLLEENGYCFTQDAGGDKYYVAPWGPIIHLYPGGEWDCDAVPADCNTLEEYLEWVKPKTNLILSATI